MFLSHVLSTGIFFVLPCTDSFVKVDLRTVSFDIPPQEVGLVQTTKQLFSSTMKMTTAEKKEKWTTTETVMCFYSRSWPRTRLQFVWMELCTSGSATPSPLWPTCLMLTLPPVCWHKPPSEMLWGQRTCLSSCLIVRASLTACRYRVQNPF